MEGIVDWIGKALGSVFGTYNERVIRGYWDVLLEKMRPLEFGLRHMPEIEKAIRGIKDHRFEDEAYLKRFHESGITDGCEAMKRELEQKLNIDNLAGLLPEILRDGGFRSLPDGAFKLLAAHYKSRLAAANDQIKKLLLNLEENDPQIKDVIRGAADTLNELMPEVFAMVREASRRTLKMRHFDSQLIGGMVLHDGKISEMATGEGKTLVATLPVFLNSLLGLGVHIVTVNDYLARRDVQWMGPLYAFLGASVSSLQNNATFIYDPAHNPGQIGGFNNLVEAPRRQAYLCDITYGTNNEFGFDYLRDNMKIKLGDQCQAIHYYAIVDEVDSILIDEARTPLIISGASEQTANKYFTADRVARMLKKDIDFTVKEKERMVILTEGGLKKAEELSGAGDFYTGENMDWPHYIETALKARALYNRDRDYLVKDGNVVIIDEFTGRTMEGRRWSDGLHQAIEAKEGVKVQEENQTLATITLQNYFRMYHKLAGMTGTAVTEATEFEKIYKLEVIVIPTNKPLRRVNEPDVIYATMKEKFEAVADEIERINKTGPAISTGQETGGKRGAGRPILVGTTSVEKSEYLSKLLKIRGVAHEVLNAKNHEREAFIVSAAGQKAAVTISTNMAGRGTDIILGEGVAALGGLHVIGTERHEARRIDNQLRGRAGRQGDPGSSQFFLSLEDDLMRLFMPPWSRNLMQKAGLKDGEKIKSKLVTRSIEKAQKNVETRNFDIRKNLLEYDEVMNKQRQVVYSLRQKILKGIDLRDTILGMIYDSVENNARLFLEPEVPEAEKNYKGYCELINSKFGITVDESAVAGRDIKEVVDIVYGRLKEACDKREADLGADNVRNIERMVLLDRIDHKWKDHLYNLDQLRETIGLRGYAHLDPKLEYKRDATDLFMEMFESVKEEASSLVFRLQEAVISEEKLKKRWEVGSIRKDSMQIIGEGGVGVKRDSTAQVSEEDIPVPVTVAPKTGRNEPCPCGSGKKYKKCCGGR